ncbi:Cob(I)yrinic acid a,c-diamide adenosyltransferase, mitochondrial [Armadillidium vulgare]|nr:Cob(I)yrinic acid a,c-diamide adenosyltransferase, mitochondrial [Armadillidium vulgare]
MILFKNHFNLCFKIHQFPHLFPEFMFVLYSIGKNYSSQNVISFQNNDKYLNCTQNERHFSSKVKIYTKTGDKGTSALYTGERRTKADHIFECLGNVDELSSFIGVAKENAVEHKHNYVEQLERIQCILQDIGTLIASPVHTDEIKTARKDEIEKRIRFSKRHIEELEGWIDHFTENLPPLSNFILPGGGRVSASLHVCRTVCRRAERSVVRIATQNEIDQNVIIYLNRLSDYLFTVSRQATIIDGKKETIYIRPKPSKKSEKEDILVEKR